MNRDIRHFVCIFRKHIKQSKSHTYNLVVQKQVIKDITIYNIVYRKDSTGIPYEYFLNYRDRETVTCVHLVTNIVYGLDLLDLI